MKKSTLNTAALLAVVLFSALSCHNRTEKEEQTFPEYSTMRLDTATAVVYNEYSTIIQSNTSVEIRPRISGYLSKKYKKEGSLVKKGDTLYVIDDADYRQQVRAAKAAMEAAKSGVSNSSLEVKKLTPLVEKGIISPYELESAKIALESAKAQYDQAAANYENARITLSYTVIKSPINGVLGLNNFSVGSLLSPSSQEPLTVISGEGDAQAYFSFDEKRLAPIRREQLASGDYNPEKNQIELILADGTPYRYKGRLSSASGIIDKTTGSIQLKVIFPNPDYSILSGSSGVLRFPLTYHGVITIPQSATYELQDRKMVFVVNEDNSLSRKSISVEGISGNYYVVSNLSSGTVIVTEGVGKLKEGMIITPKK